MTIFTGSAAAIITPFIGGEIDYVSLEKLIEFQINGKTNAIVVAGTTGEAATLTEKEYRELLEKTVEIVGKRVPVIAGSGSNCTQKAIEQSITAKKAGVDALLVVNPYYNKGTQKSIVSHYKAIAEAVDCPIIVYNVPGRTGMNMTADTILKLSEVDGIVGVKEASGNFDQIAEILRILPKDFAVYSGNDNTVVPLLSLGGVGVISVVANIMPRETHDMVESYLSGNINKARELQHKINEIVKVLFIETNPIPVKKALELMEYTTGELRLPLEKLSDEVLPDLVQAMEKLELIGGTHD